eukprot:symbB.v1.2.022439.t1/scaffold1940.1/size95532/5
MPRQSLQTDFIGPKFRAVAIAVLSAFGALLFGLDIGYIAPILECASFKRDVAHLSDWHNPRVRIDDYTSGFIVGIFSIGCIISSLPPVSAHCLNVWGRRSSIIIGSATFLVGSVLQVFASSIPMILVGRFISGLSIGLLSAVVSLYQSELAPPSLRGCLTSVYQLMITAGILLASLIDHKLVHLDDGWRWAIAIQTGPALILLICMPLMPKSPRWLVQQDRIEEALNALKTVRDESEAEAELEEIIESHEKAKALGEPTWGDLLRGRVGFLLLIGISLQLLQQLVGMNAFMYFGPRVFQDLGFDPTRFQTMSNLVNFLSTFPALLFADKYGRCRLLWWSALGMFLACMTIATISEKILVVSGEGLYTTYASTSTSGSYVIVAMVFFFVMNFAYGWGPIVWVYNSEIFPLRCRSRCVATSTCANWIGNYLIAQCTPILLGKIGFLTFYIFGSFSLLALLLAGWLPETKGVVLEQMDRVFDEKLGVVKPKAAGSYEEALLADQLEGA